MKANRSEVKCLLFLLGVKAQMKEDRFEVKFEA